MKRQLARPLFTLLTVAGIMLPGFLQADSFGASARGTTAASFLKIGVGARATAMAEAYSAVANDATALHWNPAAMKQVKGNSISLMHASYLESSSFNYGSFVHNGERSAFGASVHYFSAGDLQGRDDNGFDTGSFKPNDSAATVGTAFSIGHYSLGFSGKFIQSKIVDSANTWALDAGLLTPRYLNNKINFSAVTSNLGGKIKFDQKEEPLPAALRLGSSFQINSKWLASTDVVFPKDNDPAIGIGTEYLLPLGSNMALALRGGYSTQTAGDIDGFSGASFGTGFSLNKMALDYAFVPYGDIGSTHRISLSVGF